jgi:hypothetical protein
MQNKWTKSRLDTKEGWNKEREVMSNKLGKGKGEGGKMESNQKLEKANSYEGSTITSIQEARNLLTVETVTSLRLVRLYQTWFKTPEGRERLRKISLDFIGRNRGRTQGVAGR